MDEKKKGFYIFKESMPTFIFVVEIIEDNSTDKLQDYVFKIIKILKGKSNTGRIVHVSQPRDGSVPQSYGGWQLYSIEQFTAFYSEYKIEIENFFMKNKPVIFLDIDGVMITQWSEIQPRKTYFKDFAKPFSPESVDVLNYIIESANAEIVLSSDWRHVFNKEILEEFFNFNGIYSAPIPMPYDYHYDFQEFSNHKESELSVNWL